MGTLARSALSIGVGAALLAGCGRSQPPIGGPGAMPQSTAAKFSPQYKASPPLLFVVNLLTKSTVGDVVVYDATANDPNPIAVITQGLSEPNGDCIDGNGTLYVANRGSSGIGWVSEYPIGQAKPSKQITQGVDGPAFCTIDAQGNLWVSNAFGPDVTEYLKGSIKPHTVINNGLTHPTGIAIDHTGNLYVANHVLYGTTNVQVYPPGHKSPSRTITEGVTWPVGIGVDPKGTLYVTNDNGSSAPCNVEEYRAGKSRPYRTIIDGIDGPTAVTFDKTGRMYEVNEGTQGCTSNGPWPVILEFRAGSITPSKRMISEDLQTPVGDAYYPPLLP